MKHRILRWLSVLCALCVLGGMTACSDNESADPVEWTVTVRTAGGMPLEDVMVRFYADKDTTQLVWAGESDSNGQLTFKAPDAALTATVENTPTGYEIKPTYAVEKSNLAIVLDAQMPSADALSSTVFSLGDVMCDFTVTASENYTLSALLQEKKAVVLNFWFENCGPCRMEFPYLQEAYEAYADEVAVLAINPLDGTPSSVTAYAADLGLTFPVIAGDPVWAQAMSLTAYPTTVVIDRYGMIAMVHKGYITETAIFTTMFEHFVSDDYVQSIVRNVDEL